MRYIDTTHISVPDNWLDLAKGKYGNTYESLWSYFKPQIENIVGKKCWYSESRNEGFNIPIDHFRPKATTVKELPQYPNIQNIKEKLNTSSSTGYHFLKFEFSNYRYCCGIVNSPNKQETKDKLSRGKWDYFPISANSIRATSIRDLENEEICFLDPCIQEDTELLTFNELGFIQASELVLETSWEYCKVLVSIETYHLHYYRFCDFRIEVWTDCAKHIRLMGDLYNKNPNTELEQDNFTDRLEELYKAIKKKSEFSAVAIDCIKHYKKVDSYSWLNIFFTDETLKK